MIAEQKRQHWQTHINLWQKTELTKNTYVEREMTLSPNMAALFVFCNRGRDKIKILCRKSYWRYRKVTALVPAQKNPPHSKRCLTRPN